MQVYVRGSPEETRPEKPNGLIVPFELHPHPLDSVKKHDVSGVPLEEPLVERGGAFVFSGLFQPLCEPKL
jgi:hypothetical protein